MRKSDPSWCVAVSLLALLSLPSLITAGDQIGGIAGQINVSATIEPFMSVSLQVVAIDQIPGDQALPGAWAGLGDEPLRRAINFSALDKPEVVDGDGYVVIRVSSNTRTWSVINETTGLLSEDDHIPGDRVFVRSEFTDPSTDEGAGPGYESLSGPKLVAAGSAADQNRFECYYKLEATWEDRPGLYDGTLTFTVLPTP